MKRRYPIAVLPGQALGPPPNLPHRPGLRYRLELSLLAGDWLALGHPGAVSWSDYRNSP